MKGNTIKVNYIFVTEYPEEIRYGKEILAKKGDVQCVIVETEENLPFNDKSKDRLWIHVTECEPLRRQ